jgi:competence protein ComEC
VILILLSGAWLAGIILARQISLPWYVLLLVGLAASAMVWCWRRERRARLVGCSMLALVLGAARMELALPTFGPADLATYHDLDPLTVGGVIVEPPDVRETYTNLVVRSEWLMLPDGATRDVGGRVLIRTGRYPEWQIGDAVEVVGRLEAPPVDNMAYRQSLLQRGIHSRVRHGRLRRTDDAPSLPLRRALFVLRDRMRVAIARNLPEPQAALLSGILLGVETGIPASLMEDFSATGTTHIIAISGFNITLIAGIFASAARASVGQRQAFWVAAGGVLLYAVFVGGSAAVVRAAWMGIIVLLGRHLGRASSGLTSLSVSALAMTAWNPFVLWDLGFQLSFASTLGLMLYADPLTRCAQKAAERVMNPEKAQRVVRLVSEGVLLTLAAQLITLPLLLIHFQRLSLVTLLTNVLILPVQPAVMILGGAATLLALVIPFVGRLLGWLAWIPLTYTIEVVRRTARVPTASLPVRMAPSFAWLYYVCLICVTLWLALSVERRRSVGRDLWRWLRTTVDGKALALAALTVLAFALAVWRRLPDGRLHVVFLDVGQGDAIFIQTPAGRQALIDGGPSGQAVLDQLGRYMPFWDRTLDLVVLTHPDSDHLMGLLPVLERYDVARVLYRDPDWGSAAFAHWQALIEMEGAELLSAERGLRLLLDAGVEMDVLHPGPTLPVDSSAHGSNDYSVVTRLSYGGVSFLLPGDIEAGVEQSLLAEDALLASTVLKAAHHGSCSSTTQAFLNAVDPEVVVISVGAENDFGHPCDEVLDRLSGIPVYRTDELGTVEIVSDGGTGWIDDEGSTRP